MRPFQTFPLGQPDNRPFNVLYVNQARRMTQEKVGIGLPRYRLDQLPFSCGGRIWLARPLRGLCSGTMSFEGLTSDFEMGLFIRSGGLLVQGCLLSKSRSHGNRLANFKKSALSHIPRRDFVSFKLVVTDFHIIAIFMRRERRSTA